MPATKDPAILERNAQRIYGCSVAEAIAINGGLPLRAVKSKAHIFYAQRSKSGRRGIGWEMSFPEWVAIWLDSGHWPLRGVGKGRYCMARHGDVGPYRVGNVSIQLCTTNSRDGIKKTHARLAAQGWKSNGQKGGPGGLLGRGRGWTLRTGHKKPYQVTFGRKYVGCFSTQAEAESVYLALAVAARSSVHVETEHAFF